MNCVTLILLFFLFGLFVSVLMNFLYNFFEKKNIKKYLLKIKNFEKDLLKSVVNEYKDRNFPLTKEHFITKKWLQLGIVIKLEENKKNPLQFICVLNKKIFNLIQKDLFLRKIYLG